MKILIITMAVILLSVILVSSGNAQTSSQDILSYYRSLGSNPNVVETTDLLKAADDWSRNIASPGFTSPITTQQLLILADEWSSGAVIISPKITSFSPPSPVNDISGTIRTFNITVNQTVNVTWYINGTEVFNQTNVTHSAYTNISAAQGTWIVLATASDTNGTASLEWRWNVNSSTPIVVGIPVTPAKLDVELRTLPVAQPWKPGEPHIVAPGGGEPGIIAAPESGIGVPQEGTGGVQSGIVGLQNGIGMKSNTGSAQVSDPLSTPILNFDGIPDTGYIPPDTVGDVGPNYYIQAVNARFAIFDKAGNWLVGSPGGVDINQLWIAAGLSTDPCGVHNDGDPVVKYDRMADRWIISQFVAFSNFCVAVSRTPDPVTGGWWLYDFPTNGIENDYPKMGVWPDAYYVGTNNNIGAGHAWAFDRINMLNGGTARPPISFFAGPGFWMPSDLYGNDPPAGAPNVFAEVFPPPPPPPPICTPIGCFPPPPPKGFIVLQEFHVDFNNPGSSTFTPLPPLQTAPFNDIFNGRIEQPTGRLLDVPGMSVHALMYRMQYRNFGSYETLVFTHDVNVGGYGADLQAGNRWYELHKSGGTWSVFQQGTNSPDATNRWTGSIAMDKFGNLALGYSVSSSTVFPGIRYTGRLAIDPLNTLQAESTLMNGESSQTGSDRWGDYSSMTVDPVDDCTFWYTSEYYPITYYDTPNPGWHTRIGSFKYSSCLNAYLFQTTNNAMQINVDGTWHNSPYIDSWADGTTHTVSVPPSQAITAGQSRYNFTSWSGKSPSSSPSISITADASGAGTYTANYNTQYYLTVDTAPAGLAAISGSGWYDAGTTATLTAPGRVGSYIFVGWTIDGGEPTPDNPVSIDMNNVHTVFAIYRSNSGADIPVATTSANETNPSIVHDSNGNLYTAVEVDHKSIELYRSPENGSYWYPFYNIFDGYSYYDSNPSLATVGNYLFVAYLERHMPDPTRFDNWAIVVYRINLTDSSAIISTIAQNNSNPLDPPKIVTGDGENSYGDHDIYLVYVDESSNPPKLQFVRSVDSGSNWLLRSTIDQGYLNGDVSMDIGSGYVHVAYTVLNGTDPLCTGGGEIPMFGDVYYMSGQYNGISNSWEWNPKLKLTTGCDYSPTVAAVKNGMPGYSGDTVVVAYNHVKDFSMNSDVDYTYSDIGTWDWINGNWNKGLLAADSAGPAAAASDNRIYIAYWKNSNIYYTTAMYYQPDQLSLTKIGPINSGNSGMFLPAITINPHLYTLNWREEAAIAWVDTRNWATNGYDVYFNGLWTDSYVFQTTNNSMQINVDGNWHNSPYIASWADGTTHTVSVPPSQDRYNFTSWSGKSTSSSPSISITADASTAGIYTANYNAQTFQTTNNAMQINVDGNWHNSPYIASWADGTTHTVSVPPSQAIGTAGKSRYNFTSWSGKSTSSSPSISTTASASTAGTYTANYNTQYYLTVNASPSYLSSITSSWSAWQDLGTIATLTAPATYDIFKFSTWLVDGNPVSGNPISVQMNAPYTATAVYQLSGPTGNITGTVTDDSHAPISGATVTAAGSYIFTATTDSSGNYTISLPPGTYTLSADADGYKKVSGNVTVTAGTTATQNFALSPIIEPTPKPTPCKPGSCV